MEKLSVRDYAHIALIAAAYVVLTVTPPLNAISYGMYQFRVSEMLNFLAFYHPKYIIAVTLGCMLANLYSFELIDVAVGGGSTLIFVTLGVLLFSRYKKDYLFGGLFNKAFFYFSFFFAASMVTIAAELALLGAPFWLTWVTTAVGELMSLLVGAVIMDKIGQRFDLSQ
ncbi:QueT transporter family protein [Streptococcus pantholopis]|uniref:Queuosine transporter QueT n=1 Tax=Streptococcus pantholopis TaxID=1811193 RepID=A0A172Q875_9STRE|nr:QueT transporter family protein [Streptococcus pantholopis]AND79627.1 queuosine transporter QueT [Streptococcus pantholopis]